MGAAQAGEACLLRQVQISKMGQAEEMIRTFQYRLNPTGRQTRTLTAWLVVSCDLYNAALQERRDAWKLRRKSITYFDQCHELAEMRAEDADVRAVPSDIEREPLRRVNRAFQGFFRRCRKGNGKAGFPRFRSKVRYDSLAFPAVGMSDGWISVPKLGWIRFKAHRPLIGIPKNVIIKRQGKVWRVSIACEMGEAPERKPIRSAVGIDVGVAQFVTLSDGQAVENPRWLKASEGQLAKANQLLARKKRGSRNRLRARIALGRVHERIANRRKNFCHHVSKWLVEKYDLIAHEDLKIRNMVRGERSLNKSILDAGWNILLTQVTYKAASAGKWVVPVDPRGTSQRCSRCGTTVKKKLSERIHDCPACGLSLDRDHNAALNILAAGKAAAGLGPSEVQAT